jgi:hypothetical protein
VFEFGDFMRSEFRLKREAAVTAYEVSRKKYVGILKVEELRFLNTPTDPNLPPERKFLIERQKDEIVKKYRKQQDWFRIVFFSLRIFF